jgi:hypothetical protein
MKRPCGNGCACVVCVWRVRVDLQRALLTLPEHARAVVLQIELREARAAERKAVRP